MFTAATRCPTRRAALRVTRPASRCGPLIDGTLGARATVWYRDDGGYIDRINPVTHALEEKNTNYDRTVLVRLAAIWAASERWSVTPSVYYQDRYRNDDESYWPIYSDPSSDRYVSANPTQRDAPDTFWLPALKLGGLYGRAAPEVNATRDAPMAGKSLQKPNVLNVFT